MASLSFSAVMKRPTALLSPTKSNKSFPRQESYQPSSVKSVKAFVKPEIMIFDKSPKTAKNASKPDLGSVGAGAAYFEQQQAGLLQDVPEISVV